MLLHGSFPRLPMLLSLILLLLLLLLEHFRWPLHDRLS
jgi:hypothetical protein